MTEAEPTFRCRVRGWNLSRRYSPGIAIVTIGIAIAMCFWLDWALVPTRVTMKRPGWIVIGILVALATRRLAERKHPVRLSEEDILIDDLGSGTGYGTRAIPYVNILRVTLASTLLAIDLHRGNPVRLLPRRIDAEDLRDAIEERLPQGRVTE